MKTKMTAVAMVAVMIVAAFAVVGMADNGVADNSDATNKKEKNILGRPYNAYILNITNTVESNLEFNESAFSANATIEFNYKWKDASHDSPGTFSDKTKFTPGTAFTIKDSSNKSRFEINLTKPDSDVVGVYSVSFKGLGANPANTISVIVITVSITDKVSIPVVDENGKPVFDENNKPIYISQNLPTQTYDFNAYLTVVDSQNESIKLVSNDADVTDTNINFKFEKNYSIEADVYINGEKTADKYRYYAVGLPNGISMTVDGKISGRLSSDLAKTEENQTFTVYAVYDNGHVVSESITYSIGDKADRGFTISIDGKNYATTTVNQNVMLKITPKSGSTLNDVVVSYNGNTVNCGSDIKGMIEKEIKCTGTGIFKVSVSAQVEGSNVTLTQTVTVYVVGEIFDTDLDPEVTN